MSKRPFGEFRRETRLESGFWEQNPTRQDSSPNLPAGRQARAQT